MKVIIFDNNSTEEIINHFISYGFNSFTVFVTKTIDIDINYYKLNDISVTLVNGFQKESTKDRLSKIIGSINDRFFLVYSKGICQFDLELSEHLHKQSQKTVTAFQKENKLSALICENEIFDYFLACRNFEKDVIKAVGQDGELLVLSNMEELQI